MKRIVFVVPDAIAERMSHESVHLDVFGNVRWTADPDYVVEGSSRWVAVPCGGDNA